MDLKSTYTSLNFILIYVTKFKAVAGISLKILTISKILGSIFLPHRKNRETLKKNIFVFEKSKILSKS
jgi:hypothetical protein